MKTFKSIVLLSLVLAAFATGCESKTDKATSGVAPEKKSAEKKLSLSAGDSMKFDKAELRVKAGSSVTLTLTHTGKMKKEAMGHNFVLLKKGTDINAFGAKAMKAKDTDYVPAGEALANTKVLGGGETDTITFKAPEKGTYDFICSFPGHFAIMKGKFIVE